MPANSRALVLASHNTHKLQEIQAMMSPLTPPWSVRLARDLSRDLDWDESGSTFFDNALIKAKAVRNLTKDCVLADDSGLEVDWLKGAPGVFSSRYAGKDGDDHANNAKLLEALKGVPMAQRTARFVCTLVFIDESGQIRSFVGKCEGQIALEARGRQGFGYDPLFLVKGRAETMAELSAEEKNRLSHRSEAMALWKNWLAGERAQG